MKKKQLSVIAKPSQKRAASASAASGKRQKVSASGAYGKMWDKEAKKGWDARVAKYWNAEGIDMEGMTGGNHCPCDLKFSKRALEDISKKRCKSSSKKASQKKTFARALELGAGVGRVTKGALASFCGHIDLVELVKKSLMKAKATLPKQIKGTTFGFFNKTAQTFKVKADHYDLVWCQWLLMYLTDADAVALLKRLGAGINESGVIVVKENLPTGREKSRLDDEDEGTLKSGAKGSAVSCVRTRKHHEVLFKAAGLRIRGERLQDEPLLDEVGDEDMRVWCLVPMERAGRGPLL